MMLCCPRNRSNSFDMQIAEPIFKFYHSSTIPVAINTSQENCCLGIMANVLHLIGNMGSEDFFRMNVDKDWSWFHQKIVKKNNTLVAKTQISFKSCKQCSSF